MISSYDLIWFTYITWYVDRRFEDCQLIYMWVFLGKSREGESMKKPTRDWLTLRGWCSWKSRRQPRKRHRAIIDNFWHNRWLQQEGICSSPDEGSICRITNIHIINREMNLNDTMTWWILFGWIRTFQFEWTALSVVFFHFLFLIRVSTWVLIARHELRVKPCWLSRAYNSESSGAELNNRALTFWLRIPHLSRCHAWGL